jgi:hypothetical protein
MGVNGIWLTQLALRDSQVWPWHASGSELFSRSAVSFVEEYPMFSFLLWCVLFVLCWPLALLALILYPFVWLLLLPFRLVGIAVHGALALVREVFMLPVRLLRAPFRV